MDFGKHDYPLSSSSEIIKNKFYFGVFHEAIRSSDELTLLNTDKIFPYSGYCNDFGPLNIGQLYRYSELVENILKTNESNNVKLLHYANTGNKFNILNSSLLVCSFQILKLNKTDKEAFESLLKYSSLFISYIDASGGPSNYFLTLENCLAALYKTCLNKIFGLDLFDINDYEHYDKIENGDLNWIIFKKILAFSGPEDESFSKDDVSHSPEVYIPFFRHNNVECVIRLNEKRYSPEIFTKSGIYHYDLYFEDGGVPPIDILKLFLKICNSHHQAIAIHCEAGLGRTGTLIAFYIMYYYRFSAAEAIAWVRICRPGSILGKQQVWLEQKELELSKRGIRRNKKALKILNRPYQRKFAIKKRFYFFSTFKTSLFSSMNSLKRQ